MEEDIFDKVAVFNGLDAEQKDFLGKYIQARTIPRSTFIYNPEEPADGVYFVIDGVIKTGTINDEGKEVIKNIW